MTRYCYRAVYTVGTTLSRNVCIMKYDMIKKSAIYTFIAVTVAMTLLGVLAVWDLAGEDVLWRAFSTILVVGFGCVVIAYAASLLEDKAPESTGPAHGLGAPRPVPPAGHIAHNSNQTN